MQSIKEVFSDLSDTFQIPIDILNNSINDAIDEVRKIDISPLFDSLKGLIKR